MKQLFIVILVLIFLQFLSLPAMASYDPTTRPNNKFGIHALFTYELAKASELVNSSGGDWGYITIPIQYGDRDIEHWQKFMDEASEYHVIPILRIATEAYWANTGVWRKPDEYDIVDFANFLNALTWPTKNRYVLLFNEVNRFDEWGGEPPSPEEYADFVAFAADTFKSRNSDFFVIAGGLDNASPNDQVKYLDNFEFLKRMGEHNPDAFKKIDGFSSHSYPNPNFAQAPSSTKPESTATYKLEENIIEKYAGVKKPVFITETGWNASVLPQSVIAKYFKMVMNDLWGKDPSVIAITPFVLESNGGPFDKFTFIKNGAWTDYATTYKNLPKVKGNPIIAAGKPQVKVNSTPSVMESLKFEPVKLGLALSSKLLRSYFKAVFAIEK